MREAMEIVEAAGDDIGARRANPRHSLRSPPCPRMDRLFAAAGARSIYIMRSAGLRRDVHAGGQHMAQLGRAGSTYGGDGGCPGADLCSNIAQ